MKWSTIKNINFFDLIKDLRAEPILFLIYVSGGLAGLVYQVGKYRIICQQALGYHNEYFDCMNPASSGKSHSNFSDTFSLRVHEAETLVQKANAFWGILFSVSYMIPAFFGDTIFAALGDRYGRKNNILIGQVGALMATFPYLILFTFPQTPLYLFLLIIALCGFTGYQSIIHINFFAYLADTVIDRNNLTVRMTFLNSLSFVAGLSTPMLSALMLQKMSYAQAALICHCIGVFTFFLSLIVLRQGTPKMLRKLMFDRYVKKNGHPPPGMDEEEISKLTKNTEKVENLNFEASQPEKAGNLNFEASQSEKAVNLNFEASQPEKAGNLNFEASQTQNAGNLKTETSLTILTTNSPKSEPEPKKLSIFKEIYVILKNFWTLLKEIYQTFRKPRPGRTRAYLLVVTFVYFLHFMFEMGTRTNIFSLYVQKSPFLWGAKELGFYNSFWSGTQFAGSIVGIAVLKKLLKLRDTTIIILSMSTHVIEVIILAFAKKSFEIYVAAGIGCLWSITVPCVKSFMTQLVEPDEVGKSYTLFGIAITIGVLISGIMYGGIYMATVAYFPGFSFLLAAGLELICIGAMIWVHVDHKKNRK